MKYVYPAIFEPSDDGGYAIFFPDIKRGGTQGDTISECIEMAEDFLCLALYDMEEKNCAIPDASDINKIESVDGSIATLISVDTEVYRRYFENKLVKKTLNIPSWLNEQAEKANVNFSKTLQSALKEVLQISD